MVHSFLQAEPVSLKVLRDKLAQSLVQLVYGNAGMYVHVCVCIHVYVQWHRFL